MRNDPESEPAASPEASGRRLRAVPRTEPVSDSIGVPIETKFHSPRDHPEWVERRALTDRLAAAAVRLVLVSAPPGFGKTTLVALWQASPAESRPFAWLSLDGEDNCPIRLWWHVARSLTRASPGLDTGKLLAELAKAEPDIPATVLPLLVNALAELTGPVILVLDDYHLITAEACHEQLAFLLLRLPARVQVVLATRTAPPLPVARLRAAGEMIEVGAADLAFGRGEAAALVRAVSGAELPPGDLAELLARTEGWPAALHLAALSLRGEPSPASFVARFTGTNRFIVDFLADEVLGRQPASTRQFLARTSILGRLCAPLCDAVAGPADAAQLLGTLERENLFLIPLDEDRQWFRYHTLFAQVLRDELARTEPELVTTLHARASAWHRVYGSPDEAIRHAIAAGDIAGARGLIAGNWYAYAGAGQLATVRGWVRRLGEPAIGADAVAAHCAAWAAVLSGDRNTVRRCLPVMAAAQHDERLPDGIQSLQSSVALLQAVCGFGGVRRMREAAALAARLEDDPQSPWYALARAVLGFGLYLSGDSRAAEKPLQQAVSSQPSVPLVLLLSLAALTLVAVDLGKVPYALQLASEARALVPSSEPSPSPRSDLACVAAGAAYAAGGQLTRARTTLERAVELRRTASALSPWPTVEAMLTLARVRLDLDDRPGAAALIDEVGLRLASSPDGAQALLARLRRLQQRLDGPRAASVLEALTDREVAVLRLLQGTLSLREIAGELYLSANTVKTHTRAIYRKLGASNRQQAVKRGRQAGLL
ncbi:MAG: LuxR C-terminal-related transcriptional regulator [Streptosporangiaceae bacterium]